MADNRAPSSPPAPPGHEGLKWSRSRVVQQKSANFGASLRRVRLERGYSLNDLSKLTGVPSATLSRIENNKMSPTLTIVLTILNGLRLELTDLLSSTADRPRNTELSITRFKKGAKFALPAGDFMPLHENVPYRAFGTHMILISPSPSDAEPELIGHNGEEFFCLLEGEIMLKLKGKAPVTLRPGDTAYFQSTTPHLYVAMNNEPALGLIVHYSGQPPDPVEDMEFFERRLRKTTALVES